MGKILIININTDYWTDEKIEFVRAGIDSHSQNEVYSTRYDNLLFSISSDLVEITDKRLGVDLSSFDFVFLRDIRGYEDERHGVALYLSKNDVPYSNRDAINFEHMSKLTQNMAFAYEGLKIPKTVYSTKSSHITEAASLFVYPLILKSIIGRNGEDNFLVKDKKDLQALLQSNNESKFMIQEFIPNNFDYRIIVLGGEVKSVATRTRDPASSDHRNNVRQGAEKDYQAIDTVSKDVLRTAVKGAAAVNRDTAGVDIVVSNEDKTPYILEANYAYGMLMDINKSLEFPGLAEYFDSVIRDSGGR